MTSTDRPGSTAASEREVTDPGLEPRTDEHLIDEFEGERPGRKLSGVPLTILNVVAVRAVAVRHLLGVPADGGAGVPADLPRGGAAADLHGVPLRRAHKPPRGEPHRGGLAARRDRRGVGGLRRRHRRRAVPARGGARDPRHRDGRARDGAGARGDPPHRRLDPARHRARLHRVRLPGRADPGVVRDRAQGLRAGPHRRPGLHGPRGPVRDPPRRGGDLHRVVHHLRRRARILGRRALLRRDLLRRVRQEPHRVRAARRRWRASSSARSRARASRPRSRSAA